jgi:AraC-like DNA-binding protein
MDLFVIDRNGRDIDPANREVGTMYVSVAIMRAFVDALVHRSLPPHTLCAAAGLDDARLDDPTAMIHVADYARMLVAAHELAADPSLAARVGEKAPMGALHTVGYLLVNCRTMRDAIAHFVEVAALVYDGARWQLHEHEGQATFSFDHADLFAHDPAAAALDAEFCLGYVVGVGRRFAGKDVAPREVHFRHAAPAHAGHAAALADVFRCPVLFEQPRNEIVFKRKLLDVPQILRDESVAMLLRARAEQLLADQAGGARLEQRIVDLVTYAPDIESIDAAALARRMGMSIRTLRRRLADLDTSLATLIENARRDVARTALAGIEPIKAIAERLGYSEQSAFHRAFKRWTGMTPGQYRASRRSSRS